MRGLYAARTAVLRSSWLPPRMIRALSPDHHAVHCRRHADAGARPDHRERCAAVYARQPVRELRRDHLGADFLHHRRGDHDRAGGWLAGRFGRKYLFITCLRVHRHLHDVRRRAVAEPDGAVPAASRLFGAALVPLSQATMLDIYPVEQRGTAMAIWGVGVMIGPILGPTLGGYLTEMYNWRYVFYINLPFGILATAGLIFFMPRSSPNTPCGSTGSASLCFAGDRRHADDARSRPGPGLVQLARGHRRGGVGCLGVYLFIVHMITAGVRSSRRPCSRTGTFLPA